MEFILKDHVFFLIPKLMHYSSFFGVHPLRMTTTSSSTLKVGFAVAEEANAWEALSATKWTLMNRILNWEEHRSMLVSSTASERCSSIVLASKYDIPKVQVDLQVALLDASLQPAKRNVALFKDRLDVILEAFLLFTNTPVA